MPVGTKWRLLSVVGSILIGISDSEKSVHANFSAHLKFTLWPVIYALTHWLPHPCVGVCGCVCGGVWVLQLPEIWAGKRRTLAILLRWQCIQDSSRVATCVFRYATLRTKWRARSGMHNIRLFDFSNLALKAQILLLLLAFFMKTTVWCV